DLAFRFLALVKGKFSFSVEILCERRMDGIKSRITDVRSALDVCNEFRALEVLLKEEPKLWWKTRLVFWQSYYEQNMLFYENLSEDIRPALLKRMQGDLQNAIYRKEFSRDHFDVTVRDEMELLLESTAEFDRFQRNKEQERRQERRKEVSGKDWMAVMSEKKEDELERTTSVVDSLGLYPEPLKIRLREGLLYGFG
ncbi:MAG: hypothetical protein IJ073_01210, partial [Lachnospiraceae bacterium]|nr:hypothetical protein [Lachnospiraceae bacterium]